MYVCKAIFTTGAAIAYSGIDCFQQCWFVGAYICQYVNSLVGKGLTLEPFEISS